MHPIRDTPNRSHNTSVLWTVTLLLLVFCCYWSTLLPTACLAADGLPEKQANWGEAIEIEGGAENVRYVFDIQPGVEFIFFDLVQAHEDLVLNMTYLDAENPVPGESIPGEKEVLFLNMRLTDSMGNVPKVNFVVKYRYGDGTAKMTSVRRSEVRFGFYSESSDRWELFLPGGDDADVATRTVSQGIASSTDLFATDTLMGLFAEGLVQDIFAKYGAKYKVTAATDTYKFIYNFGDADELGLDVITLESTFNFTVLKPTTMNPAPEAPKPGGMERDVVFFKYEVDKRVSVPTYNIVFRYQYSRTETEKVYGVDKETMRFVILKDNQWKLFEDDQVETNAKTSTVLQGTRTLSDLDGFDFIIGIMGGEGTADDYPPNHDGRDSGANAFVGMAGMAGATIAAILIAVLVVVVM